MEGGTGFAATMLDGAIDDDDVSIDVDSTEGFLAADYIIIGSEEILYANKDSDTFLNCTRGYNGTTAADHADGATAYTADASAINAAMGFNINASRDNYGWASIVTVPIDFFVKTVPNIVTLNASFLTGELAIISWFFFGSGIAFIITLAIAIIGGLRS